MVHLPMVKAVISPSDIAARDFRLATLQVRDPEVDVFVDRNGKMNILTLIPQKETDSNAEVPKGEKATPKKESIGKESVFSVDSIRLSGERSGSRTPPWDPLSDRLEGIPDRRGRPWHRGG